MAEATPEAGACGESERFVRDRYHPSFSLSASGMLDGDIDDMLALKAATYDAEVRLRRQDATVSRDVIVWETAFVNPAENIATKSSRSAGRGAMCLVTETVRWVLAAMYELGRSEPLYTDNRLGRIFRDGMAAAQAANLNIIQWIIPGCRGGW